MTNSKETWKRKIMPCPPPTRWNQRAAADYRALVDLLLLLQQTAPQLVSLPLAAPACSDSVSTPERMSYPMSVLATRRLSHPESSQLLHDQSALRSHRHQYSHR